MTTPYRLPGAAGPGGPTEPGPGPDGPGPRAPRLIQRTLFANAIFSAGCGLLLVLLSGPLAPLFGLSSRWPPVLIGVGLLPFAALVGRTARQPQPNRSYVLAFAAADAVWVVGSALLLFLAREAVPPVGLALIVGVALVVATFAYLQLYGVLGPPPLPDAEGAPGLLRRIRRSWLSMKGWVKVWLFFLNAVFLAALLFPPGPLTRWVLAAYLASGPLLAGMMAWQRGLTRLLGLGHLIPWVPLVIYLVLRLTGEAAGPRLSPEVDGTLYAWTLILLTSVVTCLAFDVHDVMRWLRGERSVLGFEEEET